MKTKRVSIEVSESSGSVSAELITAEDMEFLYVLAHGAGAGMNHPFMQRLSVELISRKIGTLRYNFPYMEKGGKRPDVPAVAEKTVLQAITYAAGAFPNIRL
ncbi:MAG: alpha/beta hydrolase, partial [Bacteroidota bacterium]|nr:alpha/beta hydrolase [Bacteroidota bacterium]